MLEDGGTIFIPPAGIVARCEVRREKIGSLQIDGAEIPINKTIFGEVQNLPEPEEGAINIVSSIVAQAIAATAPSRTDVFIVDDTVRDEKGRIIGARAIARIL